MNKWTKPEYDELMNLLENKKHLLDSLERSLNKPVNIKNLDLDLQFYRNRFEKLTDITEINKLYDELIYSLQFS